VGNAWTNFPIKRRLNLRQRLGWSGTNRRNSSSSNRQTCVCLTFIFNWTQRVRDRLRARLSDTDRQELKEFERTRELPALSDRSEVTRSNAGGKRVKFSNPVRPVFPSFSPLRSNSTTQPLRCSPLRGYGAGLSDRLLPES
jgi:hypothetical protein